MYGILLRIGGPDSFRPSTNVLRPPISTVPPSGTTTVVFKVIVEIDGCWKNIVNTVGCGGEMLSYSNCGTICWTGSSGTVDETRLVNCGLRFRRTKRRSADTTGVTVMPTPKGWSCCCGWKTIWPLTWITLIDVRKYNSSPTLMLAV